MKNKENQLIWLWSLEKRQRCLRAMLNFQLQKENWLWENVFPTRWNVFFCYRESRKREKFVQHRGTLFFRSVFTIQTLRKHQKCIFLLFSPNDVIAGHQKSLKNSKSIFLLIFLPCAFLDVSKSFSLKRENWHQTQNKSWQWTILKKNLIIFLQKTFHEKNLFYCVVLRKQKNHEENWKLSA